MQWTQYEDKILFAVGHYFNAQGVREGIWWSSKYASPIRTLPDLKKVKLQLVQSTPQQSRE